jgi:hypothetical protein
MPLIKCRDIQMNATERVASRVTGAAFLIASGIVTLSSFMTWRWGGYACGHGPVFGVHQDLWQLGAPLRAWWRFVPPWLVAGGIVILALVGANELGLPIFRWLGPWRRALPMVGTAMIFVGALLVQTSLTLPIYCQWGVMFGPGRWMCVAGASLGAVATFSVFALPRLRRGSDDGSGTEFEEVSRISV